MLALRPVSLTVSSPVHGAWTGRIEGRCPHISREIDDIKIGAWARCYSPDDGRDFTWRTIDADYDLDIASPPLWKNSGSSIRPIAQYQQEMPGTVRDESDSDYEPSLKDIVVSPPGKAKETSLQNTFGREKEAEKPLGVARKLSRIESMEAKMPTTVARKLSRTESMEAKRSTTVARKLSRAESMEVERPTRVAARRLSRTESMDRGVFLLKIFSPFPGGQRRNSSIGRTSTKLPSNPELTEACKVERIREDHECRSKDDSHNNKNNNIDHKRRILGRLRALFRKGYSFSLHGTK